MRELGQHIDRRYRQGQPFPDQIDAFRRTVTEKIGSTIKMLKQGLGRVPINRAQTARKKIGPVNRSCDRPIDVEMPPGIATLRDRSADPSRL